MKKIVTLFCVSALSVSTIFAQTKKPVVKPTPKPAAAAKVVVGGAAPTLKSELDSVAYGIGVNIGRNLSQQGLQQLNLDLINKGLSDAVKGSKGAMDDMAVNAVLGKYFEKIQRQRQAEEAKASEPNKLAGEKFLADNKNRKEVVTTASGLQYEVLKAADGAKPTAHDKVKVHYHGTLIDGTVFDSSVQRGTPAEFPVGGVIQGWVEALQLMPVGSKWKLFIPYNLAYGERAAGPSIKPYSALVFEVELLEILK